MSPLLNHPGIQITRWFSIIPSTITSSSSKLNNTARILLMINFEPSQLLLNSSSSFVLDKRKDHKFRIHTIKSVGVRILSCIVCDHLILSGVKGNWGYRCEDCMIDVHKSCMMQANTNIDCVIKPSDIKAASSQYVTSPTYKTKGYLVVQNEPTISPTTSNGSTPTTPSGTSQSMPSKTTTSSTTNAHEIIKPTTAKCTTVVVNNTSTSNNTSDAVFHNAYGKLYVNLQGVHICTKSCDYFNNKHAVKVFEGDTYCKLRFNNQTIETSQVYKSADPVYNEKICFPVYTRDGVFHLELIDLTTNAVLGEMKISNFELLQRDIDYQIEHSNFSNYLRPYVNHYFPPSHYTKLYPLPPNLTQYPLYSNALQQHRPLIPTASASNITTTTSSSSANSTTISSGAAANGTGTTTKATILNPNATVRPIGFANIKLQYEEIRTNLTKVSDMKTIKVLQGRGEREFAIETLKLNLERLNRCYLTFLQLERYYTYIITWKNWTHSLVCLWLFIILCMYFNAEYFPALIFYCMILYMGFTYCLRLNKEYIQRWVEYNDMEEIVAEQDKLVRPIGGLKLAVLEAYFPKMNIACNTTTRTTPTGTVTNGAGGSSGSGGGGEESTGKKTAGKLLPPSSPSLSSMSNVYYHVKIKYIPNETSSSTETQTGEIYDCNTNFILSGSNEYLIGRTHSVRKCARPEWRDVANIVSHFQLTAPTAVTQFLGKMKKERTIQNVNITWPHQYKKCDCKQCILYKSTISQTPDELEKKTINYPRNLKPGVDYHALYYPILQAATMFENGRQVLVPWSNFPGSIQFDVYQTIASDLPHKTQEAIIGTAIVSIASLYTKPNKSSGSLRQNSIEQSVEKKMTIPLISPNNAKPAATNGGVNRTRTSSSDSSSSGNSGNAFKTKNNSGGIADTTTATAITSKNNTNNYASNTIATIKAGTDSVMYSPKSDNTNSSNPDSDSTNAITVRLQFDPNNNHSDLPFQHYAYPQNTITNATKSMSSYLYDILREQSKTSGNQLYNFTILGAYWKAKDITTMVQNEIGKVCGAIVCIENLFNWTHVWKTQMVLGVCVFLAILFSCIKARYLILIAGVMEFYAGYNEDKPPSFRVRNIIWNFVSSLPTDEDLTAAYSAEREIYVRERETEKLNEEEASRYLRFYALWIGTVQTKCSSDKAWKSIYLVYRFQRFIYWKSFEDADNGVAPQGQLIMDGFNALTLSNEYSLKPDEPRYYFTIVGDTGECYQEKRLFGFLFMDKMDEFISIIQRHSTC